MFLIFNFHSLCRLKEILNAVNVQQSSRGLKVHPKIDHKTIAMKNLITALGDKPITMQDMVNHFKELNTKNQSQLASQTHSPSSNNSTQPQVKQNSKPPLQSQQVSKPVVKQVLKSDVRLNAALQRRNKQAQQGYAQQLEQQKTSNQGLINFQSQQFAKIAVHDNSLAALNKLASFHSQSQQSFYPSLITPYPDLGQTKVSSALSQTPSISSSQTRKAPSVNEQKFNGYPSL